MQPRLAGEDGDQGQNSDHVCFTKGGPPRGDLSRLLGLPCVPGGPQTSEPPAIAFSFGCELGVVFRGSRGSLVCPGTYPHTRHPVTPPGKVLQWGVSAEAAFRGSWGSLVCPGAVPSTPPAKTSLESPIKIALPPPNALAITRVEHTTWGRGRDTPHY